MGQPRTDRRRAQVVVAHVRRGLSARPATYSRCAALRRRLCFGKARGGCGWGLFAREPIGVDEMVAEYVGELIRLPQVGRHVGRTHSPIADATVHSGRRRICTRRAVPCRAVSVRLQVANLREWWHEACAREYYQFAIDDDFCVDATLKVTP